MKKLIFISAFIFAVILSVGQQINRAEYFVDSDPGYGMATPIPVTTPGNDVPLSFMVDAGELEQGFHMIVIRARDDMGRWSPSHQQVFYVFKTESFTESSIDKAEYFIDSDPGFGLATSIPVTTPEKNLLLSFTVDVSELEQGFHMIVIRARDDMGRWGSALQQLFYVYKVQIVAGTNIDRVEYFVDSDPGFGLAMPIPVAIPEKDLSLSFDVDVEELLQGFHMIVIRARDDMGRWGNTFQQIFYVFKKIPSADSDVTGIEYFVDDDPGFGNGTRVDIASPGRDVTADFIVNMGGLSDGDHILYLRGRDALNRWSHTLAHAFTLNTTGTGKKEVSPWFIIYPNPNEGNFMIEFDEIGHGPVKIMINDLSGRVVYINEQHGGNVPLSLDLPAGVYTLTVEAGDHTFTQKLLINR